MLVFIMQTGFKCFQVYMLREKHGRLYGLRPRSPQGILSQAFARFFRLLYQRVRASRFVREEVADEGPEENGYGGTKGEGEEGVFSGRLCGAEPSVGEGGGEATAGEGGEVNFRRHSDQTRETA